MCVVCIFPCTGMLSNHQYTERLNFSCVLTIIFFRNCHLISLIYLYLVGENSNFFELFVVDGISCPSQDISINCYTWV